MNASHGHVERGGNGECGRKEKRVREKKGREKGKRGRRGQSIPYNNDPGYLTVGR